MPLDTSIPLQVQIPQFQDYSQLAAQTQQNALRNQLAQQEMQQNALRLQYLQEDRARAEATRRQSAAAAAASRKLLTDAFKAPDPAKYLIDAGRPDLLDEVTKYTESVTKLGEAKSKAQTAEEEAQLGLISRGLKLARTPEERMPLYSSLYSHPKYGSVWRQMYPDINSFAAAGEELRVKDPNLFDQTVSMTGAHYGELEKNLAKPPEIRTIDTPQGKAEYTVGTGTARPIMMNGQPIPSETKGGLTEAQRLREKRATADDYNMATTALRDIQDVTRTVDKLASTDLGGVTGYASMVPSMTETSLKAESDIESLKGKMTALAKTLSAASGKLGNLAVAEYQMLRDQIAAFDPYRGEAATKQQLNDIRTTMGRIENSVRDVYSRTYGGEDNPFEQFRELPTEIGAKTKSGANNKSIFDAADAILGGK